MKTAMQELIDRLNKIVKELPASAAYYSAGIRLGIATAKDFLEVEKQQIENAFSSGQNSAYHDGEMRYTSTTDHYYSQTFKTTNNETN